jgi:cholesterol transport system auxiliary component
MRVVVLTCAALGLTACALLGAGKALHKTDFDFGPPTAPVDISGRVSNFDVTVYEINAPAWMDHSSMYYRLAYRNASNPMVYAHSQWIMSPSALLTQTLRSKLAQLDVRRAKPAVAGTLVFTLRSELVEFEQIFDQPTRSRGVIRLRAVLDGTDQRLQRTFMVEKPAPTADAAGGATALGQCADELAALIAQWITISAQDGAGTQSQSP